MASPTLAQFFRHQLARVFADDGLTDPSALDYVSDLLARFARPQALYPYAIDGRPLEHLVDLWSLYRAAQSDARGGQTRAHQVLHHLGEYSLFMSGLFRERLRRRGELEYYLDQGASAYSHCADREPLPPRRSLFHRLHRNFRVVSSSLDRLRRQHWPLTDRDWLNRQGPARALQSSFWN
jgi:hypothetical protein